MESLKSRKIQVLSIQGKKVNILGTLKCYRKKEVKKSIDTSAFLSQFGQDKIPPTTNNT